MEVGEFLDQHGFDYRPGSGGEYAVQQCPLCGDDRGHFYIHSETGLWSCKKCDATGNLWTLRRQLDRVDPIATVSEMLTAETPTSTVDASVIDTYVESLGQNAGAVGWLLERGLARRTINHFRLGLAKEGMRAEIAIPYTRKGAVVNVKFRALPPQEKAFRVIPDQPTPLFNVDALDVSQTVYVTEGEFDAMMLFQNGYTNVVSVPLGASSFLTEHFDSLIVCQKIYLVFDADPAGAKGMLAVAERLGPERCFTVKLPVNDVTDFFRVYSTADFQALLDEAKPVGAPTIMSMSQALDALQTYKASSERDINDPRFPWPSVDRLTGALQAGWLLILQGIPFIGKSTFCLNTICGVAQNQGVPSLFYCLEMSTIQIAERIVSKHRGVRVQEIGEGDIAMARADLYGVPAYFCGVTTAELKVERIFETIRYASKRFGVRFLAFDHLHFLCRSLTNTTQEVGQVTRNFKLLLEELRISGLVVTHPPKTNLNQQLGLYGSRDSGEIAGDADVLISLFRQRVGEGRVEEEDYVSEETPSFEPRTLVRVNASRYTPGGTAVLFFDGDRMEFTEGDM